MWQLLTPQHGYTHAHKYTHTRVSHFYSAKHIFWLGICFLRLYLFFYAISLLFLSVHLFWCQPRCAPVCVCVFLIQFCQKLYNAKQKKKKYYQAVLISTHQECFARWDFGEQLWAWLCVCVYVTVTNKSARIYGHCVPFFPFFQPRKSNIIVKQRRLCNMHTIFSFYHFIFFTVFICYCKSNNNESFGRAYRKFNTLSGTGNLWGMTYTNALTV